MGASIGDAKAWKEPKEAILASLTAWPFWDDTTKRFTMETFAISSNFCAFSWGCGLRNYRLTEPTQLSSAEVTKSVSSPPKI